MLSLLNTTFTNTLRQGSTLIGSLLSKLKARSTYFENKACTKNTLGDLNSEGLLEKASIVTTPTAYSDGVLHSVKPEQTLGSELITNGDFATDSDWNKGIGWSISNNTAISDGSNTSGSIISQAIQLVEGKTYQVILDVDSVDSGRVRFYSNFLGSGGQADITSSGTFTYNLISSITDLRTVGVQARDAGTQSVINSISVKEVIDADFTFTRNSPATRVNSQSLVQSVQILGSNVVTNGDFSQIGSEVVINGDFSNGSTDWTLNDWTVADGKASIVNGASFIQQNGILETGKTYKIQYTISDYVSGNVRWRSSGVNGSVNTSNGLVTDFITVAGTGFAIQSYNNFTGSISNISAVEIIDWTAGDGWSFGGNKASCDGTQTDVTNLIQTISTNIQNQLVKISFTLDISAGTLSGSLNNSGGTEFDALTISGNYFVEATSGDINPTILFQGDANFIGSISNVVIEPVTDDTDLPRIDYRGGCGSLLLEPQATNTATDSNDFTTGDIFIQSSDPTVSSVVLTSAQATSPDGTNNAWKLVDNNDGLTNQCGLNYFSVNVISENYNTLSLFVKKQGNNDWIYLNNFGFDATSRSWFNISNGTLGTVSSRHTASIDDYGNGWYRIAVTFTTEFDLSGSVNIRLATSNGATNILRDGTNGVYIYGIQAESHATRQYATSYIPTSGSVQTRGADSSTDAGSSDLISSTEGVFYLEVAALTSINSFESIILSDGDVQNRVRFQFLSTLNKGAFQVQVGGVTQMYKTIDFTDITDFNKVAIKYKQNDFSVWLNGVKIYTGISGAIPTLNELNFNSGSSFNPFQGKVKCVAVFKEALTDAELTALTTI